MRNDANESTTYKVLAIELLRMFIIKITSRVDPTKFTSVLTDAAAKEEAKLAALDLLKTLLELGIEKGRSATCKAMALALKAMVDDTKMLTIIRRSAALKSQIAAAVGALKDNAAKTDFKKLTKVFENVGLNIQ